MNTAPEHLLLSISTCQAIAEFLDERVSQKRYNTSPWLSAPEAAGYLSCPVSRIRKLTMTGDLPVHRDGRRVLYNVVEMDEFIRRGGGST